MPRRGSAAHRALALLVCACLLPWQAPAKAYADELLAGTGPALTQPLALREALRPLAPGQTVTEAATQHAAALRDMTQIVALLEEKARLLESGSLSEQGARDVRVELERLRDLLGVVRTQAAAGGEAQREVKTNAEQALARVDTLLPLSDIRLKQAELQTAVGRIEAIMDGYGRRVPPSLTSDEQAELARLWASIRTGAEAVTNLLRDHNNPGRAWGDVRPPDDALSRHAKIAAELQTAFDRMRERMPTRLEAAGALLATLPGSGGTAPGGESANLAAGNIVDTLNQHAAQAPLSDPQRQALTRRIGESRASIAGALARPGGEGQLVQVLDGIFNEPSLGLTDEQRLNLLASVQGAMERAELAHAQRAQIPNHFLRPTSAIPMVSGGAAFHEFAGPSWRVALQQAGDRVAALLGGRTPEGGSRFSWQPGMPIDQTARDLVFMSNLLRAQDHLKKVMADRKRADVLNGWVQRLTEANVGPNLRRLLLAARDSTDSPSRTTLAHLIESLETTGVDPKSISAHALVQLIRPSDDQERIELERFGRFMLEKRDQLKTQIALRRELLDRIHVAIEEERDPAKLAQMLAALFDGASSNRFAPALA
ncbi:MAG TPA: hypothetical protein VNI01_00425, partial [Elusimicrobiota bacterium]|nr:hypothetical protein [Elusimicrobiota bacterium]